MGVDDFEKIGSFYLGKNWDGARETLSDELTLYDAKDLTTHAAVVGMTGSGKTGLCISILEEAAMDGIPAIAIDPKGDLANLLLSFPKLDAESFEPWVDPARAEEKEKSVGAFAADTAKTWREGLQNWGQNGERISRMRDKTTFAVLTPGSAQVNPVNIFGALRAGSPVENMPERVDASVRALLSFAGLNDVDPTEPAFAFLATLISNNWQQGIDMTMASLVRDIQDPPFTKVGVMELDSFYSEKRRRELATRFNSLFASPTFAAWSQGPALDVESMLYDRHGKPKLTVLSIAHLSEHERHFFVTLLLSEVVSWVRKQSGTSSLRALLYMDEVFGFLPPQGQPPSKKLFLTLLKQARAYGLGLVLATQNPVDIDYKAMSNCGTWFIGRLQSEQDVDRVLNGLKSAMEKGGKAVTGSDMKALIAGLRSRVFLMHNVHEKRPALFHTRWVMSYLRGPLTLRQLGAFRSDSSPPKEQSAETSLPSSNTTGAQSDATGSDTMPVLPEHVDRVFVEGTDRQYAPALYCETILHFTHAKSGLDEEKRLAFWIPIGGDVIDFDSAITKARGQFDTHEKTEAISGTFLDLPQGLFKKGEWSNAKKRTKDHIYRTSIVEVRYAPAYKLYRADTTEAGFVADVELKMREARDNRIEKIKAAYEKKFARLNDRIERAAAKLEKESAQVGEQKMSTAINVGQTILGALLGRRVSGRAGTAMRSATKIAKEKRDVEAASERLDNLQTELEEMESALKQQIADIRSQEETPEIEVIKVRPKKTEIEFQKFAFAFSTWRPERIE